VARYLRSLRRRGDPAKGWLTCLQNPREVIVAMDFFTVPTVTFQLRYCFFVIEHARRKILHFNITSHPIADWVVQQLRATFSLPTQEVVSYARLGGHENHRLKFRSEFFNFPNRVNLGNPTNTLTNGSVS
jgi:hypothetical protein